MMLDTAKTSSFLLLSLFLPHSTDLWAKSQKIQGFDVSNATVPTREILSGGVARDSIPAINNPRFIPADQAQFLRSWDSVVSVTVGEITRAYPLSILNHHEIVNDAIGDDYFVVTYCPLCGTAMVFNRKVGNKVRTFGVSGLLYNSDVLMYDRESESLWSQLGIKAIAGPMAGTTLEWRNSAVMKWDAWKERFPMGKVLSTNTGALRNYQTNPYREYERSSSTMFPVPFQRKELKRKDWIFGILIDGKPKAYEAAYFSPGKVLSDTVNGRKITLTLDSDSGEFQVTDVATGEAIPSVMAYWFAWQAFHPDTEVMRKSEETEK